MKIAIPVKKNSHKSEISPKFARSPYFALIDSLTGTTEFVANPHLCKQTKTGVHVFELLVENNKADTFLAFELGLRIQQMAVKKNLQLIIINHKNKSLNQITELLNKKKIYS